MWKKHNGLNQKWDIVYVKDMKPEPKKGEMNEDFGFKVEIPFHIVTKMASGRYIDHEISLIMNNNCDLP